MFERIKSFFGKWWGVFTIAVFIALEAVSMNWTSQGLALRNGPAMSFLLSNAGALGCSIYWLYLKSDEMGKALKGGAKTLMNLVVAFLGVFGIVFVAYCVMSFSAANRPEYVVEKNGMEMIAVVDDTEGIEVTYYEAKEGNFRGKDIIGKEYYGEGAFDPFETEEEEVAESGIFYDLKGNVIEQWGDKYAE